MISTECKMKGFKCFLSALINTIINTIEKNQDLRKTDVGVVALPYRTVCTVCTVCGFAPSQRNFA
jgi:hypothetical protein